MPQLSSQDIPDQLCHQLQKRQRATIYPAGSTTILNLIQARISSSFDALPSRAQPERCRWPPKGDPGVPILQKNRSSQFAPVPSESRPTGQIVRSRLTSHRTDLNCSLGPHGLVCTRPVLATLINLEASESSLFDLHLAQFPGLTLSHKTNRWGIPTIDVAPSSYLNDPKLTSLVLKFSCLALRCPLTPPPEYSLRVWLNSSSTERVLRLAFHCLCCCLSLL